MKIETHKGVLKGEGIAKEILKPLVAAVIINWNGMSIKYNGKSILDSCARSFLKDPYPNLKTFMIDGASQDDSVHYLNSKYPKIATKTVEDKGPGMLMIDGINFALQKCPNAKYVCVICNDMVFNEPCIAKLVRAAEKDESIGVVACKLLFPDGSIQNGGGSWTGIYPEYERDPKKAKVSRFLDVTYTMCFLLRASTIRQTGFFDRALCPTWGWDDFEFSRRIRRAGIKIYYVGDTNITHLESATIADTTVKKKWTREEVALSKKTTQYVVYLRYARNMFIQMLIAEAMGSFIGIGNRASRRVYIKRDAGSRLIIQAKALRKAIKIYKKSDTRL